MKFNLHDELTAGVSPSSVFERPSPFFRVQPSLVLLLVLLQAQALTIGTSQMRTTTSGAI
jgi:hypothetical protein